MEKSKGDLTKQYILGEGFNFVSTYGFTDLSVGKLAAACQMSRSGLFSHFKSKEDLQLEILKYAESQFREIVILPTTKIQSSLMKLESLCELWPNWVKACSAEANGGCLFMSASFEFDSRDGVVKEYLYQCQKRLLTFFESVFIKGIESNELRTDLSPSQLAYDFYSKYLAFHMYNHFLKDKNADKFLNTSLRSLLESIS
jgi:AcrR family transcriptional regulator